ncbi:hypothetical protein [Glutamicibacter sp. MNS18]|uniref:hypothetical protein n=1 Tax=Glutamicibacter sp. MNS18 TaxID=2989817 RepID=UPI00353193CB
MSHDLERMGQAAVTALADLMQAAEPAKVHLENRYTPRASVATAPHTAPSNKDNEHG